MFCHSGSALIHVAPYRLLRHCKIHFVQVSMNGAGGCCRYCSRCISMGSEVARLVARSSREAE